MALSLIGGITATLASGCAQMKHQAVDSFQREHGIPYYLGSWYLILYTDGKGGLTSEVVYLMDPRKRMAARPRAWFASLESVLKFDRGVLKRSEATADSTAVPKAVIAAAQQAAGMFVANRPGSEQAAKPGIPGPSIFRIEVLPPTTPGEPSRVTFVGELSDFTVEVF